MMGLPISIAITITMIISHIFFYQKKQLSFVQNSIVYMIMAMVATNYITIIVMNLDRVEMTKNPFLIIVVPLYKDLIIPILTLLYATAFFQTTSVKVRVFFTFFFFIVLEGIEFYLLYFRVFEYVRWNFFYSSVVNFAYLLVGLGLSKMVCLFSTKESIR